MISQFQSRVNSGVEVLRHLGASWASYRAAYGFRKRSGLLRRRFETIPWDAISLHELCAPGTPTSAKEYRDFRSASQAAFLFSAGELPAKDLVTKTAGKAGVRRAIEVADDIVAGRFLFYSRHVMELGQPVDWLLSPFTGGRHENQTHWCDNPMFAPMLGDIKEVWEPSRFACAFGLVRAYAMTGDEKYPAVFWELFESWCRQNPPNRGPNWKCGQETAIRVFGWCFALYGFWGSPATSLPRVAAMAKAIALSARRIEGNIEYAISQKNNHGISEAVGLLTVGLLFPEFRESLRWLRRGRELFEQEVLRQVYVDGSFVQHSMNYHRVMLHDCLWAARLCELAGEPLSDEVLTRIDRAGEFLFQMLDEESGEVPNYGSNDGALVLPLSSCDYRDYRATVQAARYFSTRKRVLADGPWNEALIWLFGAEALEGKPADKRPTSQRFDAGGYYTIRGEHGWCMMRCHTYHDRPAHVDPLHVDLWHRGVNILGDSGTFKYFAPESPGLDKYFKDIQAHNTIEIDRTGPLKLISRFLWVPWPTGRCHSHSVKCWQGEHDAYDREPWHVQHRREVRHLSEGEWLITDVVDGEGMRHVALRWHCVDVEYDLDVTIGRLTLPLDFGRADIEIEGPRELRFEVKHGVETPECIGGWTSDYYGEKTPRPTLIAAGTVKLPATLVTRIKIVESGGK